MPGWLKALLIILVVIVVLVAGVVIAGVVWIARNKDSLIARGREVATEGRKFGQTTDNRGCVDESVARYKREPGFGSALSTSIFMRTCLDNSRPTPGFCNDVPHQSEIMKTAQWRVSQCRRVELATDNNCQNLLMPIQQFCEEKGRTPRNENSEN